MVDNEEVRTAYVEEVGLTKKENEDKQFRKQKSAVTLELKQAVRDAFKRDGIKLGRWTGTYAKIKKDENGNRKGFVNFRTNQIHETRTKEDL